MTVARLLVSASACILYPASAGALAASPVSLPALMMVIADDGDDDRDRDGKGGRDDKDDKGDKGDRGDDDDDDGGSDPKDDDDGSGKDGDEGDDSGSGGDDDDNSGSDDNGDDKQDDAEDKEEDREDEAEDKEDDLSDKAEDKEDEAEDKEEDEKDKAEDKDEDEKDKAEDKDDDDEKDKSEDKDDDKSDKSDDKEDKPEDEAGDKADDKDDDSSGDSGDDSDSGTGVTGLLTPSKDDFADSDRFSSVLEAVQIDSDAEGFDYRRGEIVAMDLQADSLAAAEDLGFSVVQILDLEAVGGRVYLLRNERSMATPDALALMAKAAPGATLAPNHLFYAPSADGPSRKGASAPVKAPACNCQIAMLDTGVEPRHPSLSGVKVRQRAFASGTATPAAHGSAVASLMFGAETGASQLYVADVFGGAGGKAGAATVVIRGLEWLASTSASVINISLAGPSNPVVEAVIAKMSRRGKVIVAAVGNDGPAAPPAYPAAQPEVVAVTAVDPSDKIYRYAVRGRHVAFAAAGVMVTAASPEGGYARVTGTSFAAPVVAGRIARIMAASPKTDGREAVNSLQKSAIDLGAPGRDAVFGFGVVRPNTR